MPKLVSLIAAGFLALGTFQAAAAVVADTLTLQSPKLPQPMKVTVAAPDGPGPYPTLYLLNGYGGDYRKWPELADIDSIARTKELIVVCPSGMNCWYWDSPAQIGRAHV